MRVDRDAVTLFDIADGVQPVLMGRFAGLEAELADLGKLVAIAAGAARQVEAAFGFHLMEQSAHAFAVAIQQIVDETLEIRGFADVHARAAGVVSLGRFAHPVDTGAEKLIQHVVLVSGCHQLIDRQAHHAGDMAGADIAEIA